MQRRKYVLLAAGGLFASVAGCIGDDEGDTDDGDDSSDVGFGDDGNDAFGGDDTGDDTDDAYGADDGSDETDDSADDDDDEVVEESDDSGGDGPAQTFQDVFAFTDNYAMDVEFTDPESGQSGRFEGRHRDGNIYQNWQIDGMNQVWEMYRVDGDTYMIMGDMCILDPDDGEEPDLEYRDEDFEEPVEPDLQPDGTDQIDGNQVYVYRVTDPEMNEEMTYYVDSSTGYLRRIEWEYGVMNFHSWGEVEPISAPDMDCESYGP